jgi:hypothetical protein
VCGKHFSYASRCQQVQSGLLASDMVVRYSVTEKTARCFMLKVQEAMFSSGNNPMDGTLHVAGFILVGKEKGKIGRSYDGKKKRALTAIQLTEDGEVKRIYAMKINDFSA